MIVPNLASLTDENAKGRPVKDLHPSRRMIKFSDQTVRDKLKPQDTLEIRVTGRRPDKGV